MSQKHEKQLRAIAQAQAQALPRTNAARFHPQRDLLLCRAKMETVSAGGIHLPQQRASGIAVPIGEILDCGPKVEGYEKGELILFATSAALAIDGDLFVLESGKVLCKVDAPSKLATV